MVSNFSTIYDQLISLIPTLTGFTTKTQIPNPSELESNDDNLLRNGWGLVVGDSSPSDLDVFNKSSIRQVFGIVLTRELNTQHHVTTQYETAVKALIEDEVTLRLRLLQSNQINIPNNIELIQFLNRTAIEYVSGDIKCLTSTVNFFIDITEDI